MKSKKVKLGTASSAKDWRARASRLFVQSDGAGSQIGRESLRRRAVAADNIAESMELGSKSHCDFEARPPEGRRS